MAVSERFQGANVVDAGRLSPYWGEHAARYVFSLPFVENKTVLDIACGTGYGLGLLRRYASYVVGADIDVSTAKEAVKEIGESGAVMLADGRCLPFADAIFDVITSFETLEHLNERSRFLNELRRVLKPEGVLLLSTPNANYSQPVGGMPSNPFHVYEYRPSELLDELGFYFAIDSFFGQTLDPAAGIPPFYDAQRRLPRDIITQIRLFAWKVFNKVPFAVRERLSEMVWNRPFYPTEMDYNFSEKTVESAPTLFAVCRKK